MLPTLNSVRRSSGKESFCTYSLANRRKQLQRCISEYANTSALGGDGSQTCREGQRQINKVVFSRFGAYAAKRIQVNTSACVFITWPDTFVCCDSFMRTCWKLLHWGRGGSFTGNKCGGKQWIIRALMNGWRNVQVSRQRQKIKKYYTSKATVATP